MANREQHRRNLKQAKATKIDPNKDATKAAQILLDSAAILVQHIKKGDAPTHLEVMGLASIILNDVYQELMKEMTGNSGEHKPEIVTAAEAAESEK